MKTANISLHHTKYYALELTRVLKLRQIEPEFLERMFSVEDV